MKKIFSILVVSLFTSIAFALPPVGNVEFSLNHGGAMNQANQLGSQVVSNKIQTLKCTYDFSKVGGAISTKLLKGVDGANCALPSKAVVIKTSIDVVIAPTSAGAATIAVGTGVAINDIKAATAIASFTGVLDGIQDWLAANAVKTSAIKNPSMSIAAFALTAGKFNVFISYYLSD